MMMISWTMSLTKLLLMMMMMTTFPQLPFSKGYSMSSLPRLRKRLVHCQVPQHSLRHLVDCSIYSIPKTTFVSIRQDRIRNKSFFRKNHNRIYSQSLYLHSPSRTFYPNTISLAHRLPSLPFRYVCANVEWDVDAFPG